jgi:hypothetical protein
METVTTVELVKAVISIHPQVEPVDLNRMNLPMSVESNSAALAVADVVPVVAPSVIVVVPEFVGR